MSSRDKAPDYLLRLRPLDGPGWQTLPPWMRLKALLKRALRTHGLRCTECRTLEPESSDDPTQHD